MRKSLGCRLATGCPDVVSTVKYTATFEGLRTDASTGCSFSPMHPPAPSRPMASATHRMTLGMAPSIGPRDAYDRVRSMRVTRVLDVLVLLLLATLLVMPRPNVTVKAALAIPVERRERVAELQAHLLGTPDDVNA